MFNKIVAGLFMYLAKFLLVAQPVNRPLMSYNSAVSLHVPNLPRNALHTEFITLGF